MNENEREFFKFLNLKSMQHKIVLRFKFDWCTLIKLIKVYREFSYLFVSS